MNKRKAKVVLSTVGKFHTFSLGRQLHSRGMLSKIYTTYPLFKLKNEKLPVNKIYSRPFLRGISHYVNKLPASFDKLKRYLQWLNRKYLEKYIYQTVSNEDVYVGLSGHCLAVGTKFKKHGAKYICDRGSSHIVKQNEILFEEYKLLGMPYQGIDKRTIQMELAEYDLADLITVPSQFVFDTFIEKGIDKAKLRIVPYGVDLTKFQPVDNKIDGEFQVLFVGGDWVRKGVFYLIQAFEKVNHPNKKLHLVGAINTKVLEKFDSDVRKNIVIHGIVPQQQLKLLYSQANVFCLPSLEEGLAMVMAEAMACGCPVIATTNTGAANLFNDGKEGFIIGIREVDALAERIQRLCDNPLLQDTMSKSAISKVKDLGGWDTYGDQYTRVINGLIEG